MREITFYNPGKSFPSVSVTGETCELDCAHCKKKFLHGMIPATNPQDLVSTCASLWREGVSGVLVSGGCDREGRVPFFPEALSEIREKTGLILNLHTGFVDEANLAGLLRASPHYVSFDIPTDHALKEIYGLPRRSEEYIESLSLLKRNNLNAVPHICLGLGASQTEDEGMLRRVSEVADGVVLNIVVPAFGTVFEGKPVDEKRIIEEFACARALFSRMTLGCMRPRRKRIEEEAPLFDGIVAPTRWARAAARSAGLTIKEKNTCCVVY